MIGDRAFGRGRRVRAALDANGQRIAALEQQIAALTARLDEAEQQRLPMDDPC